MRHIRYFLFIIVFLLAAGLVAALAAGQPVQAQSGNLLQNPGFEAGVYRFDPDDYAWVALYGSQREDCQTSDGQYLPCNTAQVPMGWIPWWISHNDADPDWKNRMPEYKPAEAPFANRIQAGSRAAQYFTFHSTHTAGLLQVADVPANARVRFSIWGQAWSSAEDTENSTFPTTVNMRIGIDPAGGTNPYSPAIVWSDYKQPYDVYQQFVVEATAQGSKVTVFTISSPDEARKHNDIYWDSAELVALGGQAAAPPPPTSDSSSTGGTSTSSGGGTTSVSPPPALGPTATPNADGIIYAEVQPGDSFWSIAARNGITLEEIYTLNNASDGDFVQEGELLIVGMANGAASTAADDDATAEEVSSAEASAEGAEGEEGEAETAAEASTEEGTDAAGEAADASPTPVPPLPTATAAPTSGEVCLAAFVDEDQNGEREESEPFKGAVAFTLSDGEAVVSNYVTTGSDEPYCITGLPGGNYRVTRSTTSGEVLTTSGERSISVVPGTSQTFEFGSYIDETAVAAVDTEAAQPASGASLENAALASDETAEAEEGGITRILIIAAVVVAVLLFVGVLVVILSARRSTI